MIAQQSSGSSTRGSLVGFVLGGLLCALLCGLVVWITVADHRAYWQLIYRTERSFIEALPTYDDYATPEMEAKLRTYLLPHHLEAARRSGVPAPADDRALAALVKEGLLKPIEAGSGSRFYFYNVRREYRLLTPAALAGLEAITTRFQEKCGRGRASAPVKIALSSLVRPVAYQGSLKGRNLNAAYQSSHPHGISFDIFYDDYRVVLPEGRSRTPLSRIIMTQTRERASALLGSSLRRQFRSALMETLMELQDEGLLYAILEKNQHCYHVTILPRP